MQTAQNLPVVDDLGEDLSGLRKLFARSFPFQGKDALEGGGKFEPDSFEQSAAKDEEFDWSITLGNINELTETAKVSAARIQAAEERAVRAEARAKEAEHWLRHLHQAVLEGLPNRSPSK